MVPDSWSILGVVNGPGILSNEVAASMKMAACILFKFKRKRMKFGSGLCDGILETDWESKMIGARSGILFYADIHVESGPCNVNFILSEDDLEEGARRLQEGTYDPANSGSWSRFRHKFPDESLYQFRNLRGTRLN